MLDTRISLREEYEDLEEEYWYCDNQGERQRCASRMDAIINQLREST